MVCHIHMMEKLFDSSVEQPVGTSPNTSVFDWFGGLTDANQGFLETESKLLNIKHSRSIRDHAENQMHTHCMVEKKQQILK